MPWRNTVRLCWLHFTLLSAACWLLRRTGRFRGWAGRTWWTPVHLPSISTSMLLYLLVVLLCAVFRAAATRGRGGLRMPTRSSSAYPPRLRLPQTNYVKSGWGGREDSVAPPPRLHSAGWLLQARIAMPYRASMPRHWLYGGLPCLGILPSCLHLTPFVARAAWNKRLA